MRMRTPARGPPTPLGYPAVPGARLPRAFGIIAAVTPDQYKAITRGAGARLRDFFGNATNRTLATRSVAQLRGQLLDAEIPVELHDELLGAYRDLVRKGRDEGANRFRLRQEADQATLKWLSKIEAADDILGESSLDQAATDEDHQAARDLAKSIDGEGRETQAMLADLHERSNAAERQRTGQV
jgi:hypothetical protein